MPARFWSRDRIDYAIYSKEEAEGIYREVRVKYEKAILLNQIYATQIKRKVKRIQSYQYSTENKF